MSRNKFYAFFKTEEEYLRFTMKYLDDHPEVLRARDNEIRHFTRVFTLDFVTMALGRMGFREKKYREFDESLKQVNNEYGEEFLEDLKCDKSMVYSRDLFERELKQYTGNLYVPDKERYA